MVKGRQTGSENQWKLSQNINNVDRSCDAARATQLVRRNVQAAHNLQRNHRQIDIQKVKLQSYFEKQEKELLVHSEQTRKCSGRLMIDLDLIKSGLPQVILSPSTTQRSRISWQERSNHSKEAPTASRSRSYTTLPATTQASPKHLDRHPTTHKAPSLPRLQKALADLKRETSDISLYCKKVPVRQKQLKTTNETRNSRSRGSKEKYSTTKQDHLTVPFKIDEKYPNVVVEDSMKKEALGNSYSEQTDDNQNDEDDFNLLDCNSLDLRRITTRARSATVL